jgi:hypothetical protein
MKNLITLLILVFAIATNLQAQAEKTLVKSIALEGTTAATVTLPGEVTTSEWDKDFIRVTATINVLNFDENITKRLVIVGRYELKTALKDGKMTIEMPKVSNLVTIRGTQLQETFSFELNVPKNYNVQIINTAAAEAATIGQNL